MPKKKGHSKLSNDFTLDDYANAQKPASKAKNVTAESEPEKAKEEVSWDEVSDDEGYDIVKDVNSDGSVTLVCIKTRKKNCIPNEYPEVVWYEISRRIDPQDIGRFAGINKTTYAITQQKSFWVHIYEKHCKYSYYLPCRLRIEDGAKAYGYKTRVIQALYYTNSFFKNKVVKLGVQDSKPHDMLKRPCVNMWLHKNTTHWSIFFKFKKLPHQQTAKKLDLDFIDELGRLDANPEIDNQVLQVNCEIFYQIPPLMGMTLTSVKLGLSQSLLTRKLIMGFNSGLHVVKDVLPECSLVIDTVTRVMVIDWWHPNYPQFKITFPWKNLDREREDKGGPILDRDFFGGSANGDMVRPLQLEV